MSRILYIIVATGIFVSASAQINIFGKVQDTSGTLLDGAIVSLVAHPAIADTTTTEVCLVLSDRLPMSE